MSFFQPENIRIAAGGQWMRQPDESTLAEPVAGFGIDTREDLANRAFVAIRGERFDGHSFLRDAVDRGARLVIVDRPAEELRKFGLPEKIGVMRVEDTRRALGEIARSYRRTLVQAKVIAITGSSGKTTTKRLIHAALSTAMRGTSAVRSFNNDIGVPLTILSANPLDRFIVVEIGTNAPGEIAQLAAIAEPDIAVITSIGRSHLEGLGTVAGVAAEKAALMHHIRKDGVAIVTADAPEMRDLLRPAPRVVLFGEADDADLRLTSRGSSSSGWWLEANEACRFELSLPGRHNAVNALAAIAVGRQLAVPDERINAGLREVKPDAMRLCAQTLAGATVWNDAYNANPDSVAAAIETFIELTANANGKRIVVLGDMLELGKQSRELHKEVAHKLVELAKHTPVHRAVFIGHLARHGAEVVRRHWREERVQSFEELTSDTISAVLRMIAPGDMVLIKGSRGAALERIAHAMQNSRQPIVV